MNGFSGRVLLVGAFIALLLVGSAGAQNGTVSIYKVGGLKGGFTVNAGANLRFLIKYTNDVGDKCDISNGFKISSPDGATWDSTTIDSIGPINDAGTPGDPTDDYSPFFNGRFDIVFSMDDLGCNGISPDTVGVLGAGTPSKTSKQLPAGYNDSAYAILVWFDGKTTSAGKHICIDSSFYGSGGTWKWVTKTLVDVYPAWAGLPGQPYSNGVGPERDGSGFCFDIYAPALQVSTDSLGFSMQSGGVTPPSQTFTVASTGDAFGENLAFTLTESSGWLVKSPSSGTTPRTITVTMNPTGLAPGLYVDSIKVEAPAAGNSPRWVKVTFEVIAPPPTIFASKSSLTYSALTGGADPAAQTFYIKNTGGMTLNWNLTWNSTWLSATPAGGIDSNLVTVSASIAALGAGDYYDTIRVDAAGATNTPVKIPVKLSLGSSLPMIATDSAVYHVIVDIPNNAAPRTVRVFNSGIGILNFTLSSNSTRITSYVPSSGAAPQNVTVGFKILNGIDGQQYWDTLWVTSPEAVNSPFPIVFHSKILDTPAFLKVSKDTIKFTTYGCMDFTSASANGLVTTDTFLVYDSSGADRPIGFTAKLLDTSDLCTVMPNQGEMPLECVAQASFPSLAEGVYYDTILVGVDFAYNSPETVIVKYTRIATGPNPSLIVSEKNFDIPRQWQTGPTAIDFNITNGGLGCLPWTIEESIPWFTPSRTSGNVPTVFGGVLETNDLPRGIYTDSFRVVAPLAGNSPQIVHLRLRMWTLHGDCNWDGFINLIDLSWLIAYLLNSGQLPLPEYAVGDTNCSGLIDLQDLSLLIAYLTAHGTICGNP